MRGQPAHNTTTRLVATQFLEHGCDSTSLTSQLSVDVALIRQLHESLMCLFFDVIPGRLYNRTLADVRSTGAGIKYLYSTFLLSGNPSSPNRINSIHMFSCGYRELNIFVKVSTLFFKTSRGVTRQLSS